MIVLGGHRAREGGDVQGLRKKGGGGGTKSSSSPVLGVIISADFQAVEHREIVCFAQRIEREGGSLLFTNTDIRIPAGTCLV